MLIMVTVTVVNYSYNHSEGRLTMAWVFQRYSLFCRAILEIVTFYLLQDDDTPTPK